jgi:hypothetical protein
MMGYDLVSDQVLIAQAMDRLIPAISWLALLLVFRYYLSGRHGAILPE